MTGSEGGKWNRTDAAVAEEMELGEILTDLFGG